jgi:hypothetical protein
MRSLSLATSRNEYRCPALYYAIAQNSEEAVHIFRHAQKYWSSIPEEQAQPVVQRRTCCDGAYHASHTPVRAELSQQIY